MPRPTPAQFLYGSATVVLSTLAMLLLSGADSGPGVVVVTFAGLALGVLVALALGGSRYGEAGRLDVPDGTGTTGTAGAEKPTTPRSGPRRGAERVLSEHSLRR